MERSDSPAFRSRVLGRRRLLVAVEGVGGMLQVVFAIRRLTTRIARLTATL
jgi:hypothetical protein